MVTNYKSSGQKNSYYGLSTDTKPTGGVPNASSFYEMDTGDIYLFDKQNQIWIKQ